MSNSYNQFSIPKEKKQCNGLNICVCQKFVCWNPNPHVMVFRSGPLRGGYVTEGEPSWRELVPLSKWCQSPLFQLRHWEVGSLEPLTRAQQCWHPGLSLPACTNVKRLWCFVIIGRTKPGYRTKLSVPWACPCNVETETWSSGPPLSVNCQTQ